jgi:hypothetical protein
MPKIQTFNGYKFHSTLNFTVGDILTGKVRVRKGGTILRAVSQDDPEFSVSILSPDPDEWKNIKAKVLSVSDDGKITAIERLEGGENITIYTGSKIVLQTDDQGKQPPYPFNVDEYALETVE